jgi:catechol 2,3-dioxygenase-like lactoylglutathione lyase family enzyme
LPDIPLNPDAPQRADTSTVRRVQETGATAIAPTLNSAAPVLASLDIERTVTFYCVRLGFTRVYVDPGVWGIVARDSIQIHFWPCSDRNIAENTSCRVHVSGIEALFAELQPLGVVHPQAQLQLKPWGSREFGVLDPDGNLITFAERNHA